MNSVEKSLLNSIDKMVYGHFDTVETFISFKTFTDPGFIKCPVAIDEMTIGLYDALKKCKHPTLNPSIDEIYKFKEENKTGKEALKKYIEKLGEFKTERIDNKRSFLEIVLPFKFLFVNIAPFVKDENFTIESATIQTPLFRKEIK